MENSIRCIDRAFPPVVMLHIDPIPIVLPADCCYQSMVSLEIRLDIRSKSAGVVLVLHIEQFAIAVALVIEPCVDIV